MDDSFRTSVRHRCVITGRPAQARRSLVAETAEAVDRGRTASPPRWSAPDPFDDPTTN